MIRLVHADALDIGAFVAAGTVELAYLDPPFAVGAEFTARTRPTESRGRSHGSGSPHAYSDVWPSLEAYLEWLQARVAVVREALSDEGTMWLHLDHRAVHEAKALCDHVFGRGGFLGEVIWVPGNGSKKRRGPGMTHQTLLVYARSQSFVWNAKDPTLREPFAATSLSMHFQSKDEAGRSYRDRTVGGKTYRYYADEGRTLGSVWTDCPAMVANTPLMAEGTGYPTQKPMKLLERIVRASSRPGALVVDPFCGSGTTLCAAAQQGRDALGMDTGELAVATTTSRLERLGLQVEVTTGLGNRRDESRLPPRRSE
jgi:site-specific DNA-methyltransferase (adenine-specific)